MISFELNATTITITDQNFANTYEQGTVQLFWLGENITVKNLAGTMLHRARVSDVSAPQYGSYVELQTALTAIFLAANVVYDNRNADGTTAAAGSAGVIGWLSMIWDKIAAAVLPDGAATEAKQTEANATLVEINDKTIAYSRDAFGLLEVSTPKTLFDAQFTHDLQPLLYEQVVTGLGVITHDATNRCANIGTTGIGTAFMQTFEYFRYQPAKGHKVLITFNFGAIVAGTTHYAQYGDSTNAIGLRRLPTGVVEAYIITGTTQGNQTIVVDTTGFDLTKEQILTIEFQALYVGTVRLSLQKAGVKTTVATFFNDNTTTYPYIQTANLPVRVGISKTTAGAASMLFNCVCVQSMAGEEVTTGFPFTQKVNVTAANGVNTHAISLRPKLLFNGIQNRTGILFLSIDLGVTGNSPVDWYLAIGQSISGTTTFNDVNTAYSAVEYNTAGTISGSPALIVTSGTVLATANTKNSVNQKIFLKYPISLDAAGAHRALGTLTLYLNGVGGASATRVTIDWLEIR